MKRIEIIVEHESADRLAVALPHAGVSSVTIGEVECGATVAEHARQFHVELLVENHAVDHVMAGLSFAVGVGLMGECKGAWISPAQERPVNA